MIAINQHYNWKRFWCPRGGSIFLTKAGYLDDWGKYNKNIATLDSMMSIPCLVLLGEPGMGKSSVLKSEWQQSIPAVEKEGHKTLWVDLERVINFSVKDATV